MTRYPTTKGPGTQSEMEEAEQAYKFFFSLFFFFSNHTSYAYITFCIRSIKSCKLFKPLYNYVFADVHSHLGLRSDFLQEFFWVVLAFFLQQQLTYSLFRI